MIIREALRADLPAIIALLADDVLGKAREFATVDDAHEKAFADVDADPRSFLIVAQDGDRVVVSTQVTYIPGLGRHGAERSQVEAVRVHSARRGHGVGPTDDDVGDRTGSGARVRHGAVDDRHVPG